MKNTLEEAKEELKRADHSIYITLKYVRTCDIILNTIKRLINAFDLGILALLKKLHEDKKIKQIPISVVERCDLVEKVVPKTKPFLKYYKTFKKLTKCEYSTKEEFRKHITLISKDKKPIEVNVDTLIEYFEKTIEFIRFVEQKINE